MTCDHPCASHGTTPCWAAPLLSCCGLVCVLLQGTRHGRACTTIVLRGAYVLCRLHSAWPRSTPARLTRARARADLGTARPLQVRQLGQHRCGSLLACIDAFDNGARSATPGCMLRCCLPRPLRVPRPATPLRRTVARSMHACASCAAASRALAACVALCARAAYAPRRAECAPARRHSPARGTAAMDILIFFYMACRLRRPQRRGERDEDCGLHGQARVQGALSGFARLFSVFFFSFRARVRSVRELALVRAVSRCGATCTVPMKRHA